MAKRLMCVCFGVLALVAAFHLGDEVWEACYADHTATVNIGTFGNDVLPANGVDCFEGGDLVYSCIGPVARA